MTTSKLRVVVLYWTDPWRAVAAGGIDSYIGCFLKYAPADVEIEVIGVTADPRARPVGRWLDLPIANRTVRFFALFAPQSLSRPHIPLSVRYSMGLMWHPVRPNADIAIAHRAEPVLFAHRTKTIVLVHHTGPSDIPDGASQFRWPGKRGVYDWLESMAVRRVRRIHTVTQHALEHYRASYRRAADDLRFFPTFFDPAVFKLPSPQERALARKAVRTALGLPAHAAIAVSVGRLDHQKDYFLSLAAFALLSEQQEPLFLVIIGEGMLRARIEASIRAAGMQKRILLLGEKAAEDIAATHYAADLFLLTSAYEGMSIALLEAQACGLPVVVPDVGEARQTVRDGVGHIAARTARGIADAISLSLKARESFEPELAARAVAEYSAANVVPQICRDLLELAQPKTDVTEKNLHRWGGSRRQ
jgi:glycosyltransferase involved in cell wall biosynthesis